MLDDYYDYQPTTNMKQLKIYRNGNSNLCCNVTLRDFKMNEVRTQLQQKWESNFAVLRLFNQEGVEIGEDDLDYQKNGTVLFASKGEEFDESFQLTEYEIIKDIGEGGFGKVQLGKHKQTGELVAIKMLKCQLNNAQDVDMMFREARALKSLKHDHIVKIYNAFFLKNMQAVYIMEYLGGGELLDLLQQTGTFSENEALNYFKQIVSALNYCHNKKIIHRDLKLENLLLAAPQSKIIKCIDFGISGFSSQNCQDEVDVGSLKYMAPELLKGMDNAVTPLVDIWAMGIILYGMLYGTLPFNGETNREVIEEICGSKLHLPDKPIISLECKDCILRCLEPDPKQRISSNELVIHPFLTGEKIIPNQKEEIIQKQEQPKQQQTQLLKKPQLSKVSQSARHLGQQQQKHSFTATKTPTHNNAMKISKK